MASVDSAEAIVTAPAQARFFAGFGFGYPFYRPYPVFYPPYLLPPPPPPVAYDDSYYSYRRPVHRHRRTVSHRTCTCK
jgi:hypothetical protein